MRVLFPASALLIGFACTPDYDLNPESEDPPPVQEPEEDPPPVTGEPIADAGPDQEVNPLDTVIVNGIASYDPNGLGIVDYQWTLVSKPSGSTATLQSMGSPNTRTFFADLAGDYVLELTVQNDAGIWDSTPDELVVTAVPGDGFYVQMSWNTSTDQDLHLLREPSAMWETPGDCNYCNMNPDWGTPGNGSDDPSLDYDTIPGFGPETITIDSPAAGDYRVQAHFYGQDGGTDCMGTCPSTDVKVDVYIGGVHAGTYNGTVTDAGAVWDVATIHWPSQTITVHDTYTWTYESGCL